MELEIVIKFWPILVAMVVVIIWNIRLESKVLYLEKDHEREVKASAEKDKIMWSKFDNVVNELSDMKLVLTKLQTTIEMSNQTKQSNSN